MGGVSVEATDFKGKYVYVLLLCTAYDSTCLTNCNYSGTVLHYQRVYFMVVTVQLFLVCAGDYVGSEEYKLLIGLGTSRVTVNMPVLSM